MEIIKLTPDMVFLLETDGPLPELQKTKLLEEWSAILPNKLLIVKKGALSVLSVPFNKE